MQIRYLNVILLFFPLTMPIWAQQRAIINNAKSPHSALRSVDLADVKLTGGFWAEKFDLVAEKTLAAVWAVMASEPANSWHNMQVAAGVKEGTWQRGASWNDGDLYKWVEAASQIWLVTQEPKLDRQMDDIIAVIAKAQQPDGYIATRNQLEVGERWQVINHHELYNMGHLMTAACMHYRATGKRNFLDIAIKVGDYLHGAFVLNDDPKMWVFAFNPSQIMGAVELYRTTDDVKYLDVANRFIDNRGKTKVGKTVTKEFAEQHHPGVGTDHNQDRVPIREESEAVGHAVLATYMYCGATDAALETGDKALMAAMERIWNDVTKRKMYIHGGVGPLTHGLSIRRDPVHEAFGDPYYLHNRICYCETCANIGNGMWNWRMLNMTGDSRFADIMERVFYNAGISGLGLDGATFFYTNVLRRYGSEVPLLRSDSGVRWVGKGAICCPPSLARTIAEMRGYFYSTSPEGLWVHMFAGNELDTRLQDGTRLKLTQVTDYPWAGHVRMTLAPERPADFALLVRIPRWAAGARLTVNGATIQASAAPGQYARISRQWKNGDVVELQLPMEPRLVETNPLVEETRNEAAVFRGPVLYCLESVDLPEGVRVEEVMVPQDIRLTARREAGLLGGVPVLEGQALRLERAEWSESPWYKEPLYRRVESKKPQPLPIRLVPYHTWANRGRSEMTVFMPIDW